MASLASPTSSSSSSLQMNVSTSTNVTTSTTSSKKSLSGMGCGRPGYITCSICSATKYYSHVQRRFGQFSCEPCSKFMKRFLRDPKKFTCYESGQCLIGRPFGEQEPRGVSVSRCKACWLKICLDKFTIEPSIREVINCNYLPTFTNSNGNTTTISTHQSHHIMNKSSMVQQPASGLYAPGTAILLGQHNLNDLPLNVIPIPVRKRKVKGQPGDKVKGQGRSPKNNTFNVSGKNGPPITDGCPPTINSSNCFNDQQQLINTSSLMAEVLIRSPTSLSSSSTSVSSLPGSVTSTSSSRTGRRSGTTTCVKYKKCSNSLQQQQKRTSKTIKSINHDIDDNVFRPIQVLGGNGVTKRRKQVKKEQQHDTLGTVGTLLTDDQTIINDPVASLLVYGDHDYNLSQTNVLTTTTTTTDEDDEVEGHFNGLEAESIKRVGGGGRRSDEEDYFEESDDIYDDEDDYHSDDHSDEDDDKYHSSDDDHHNDHRKKKRSRRGIKSKSGGAKRGLNDVINGQQQHHEDGHLLEIDPKAPIVVINQSYDVVDTSHGQRRIDPESPKAATRVEDVLFNHSNDLASASLNCSSSNQQLTSSELGSMVDLTSDLVNNLTNFGKRRVAAKRKQKSQASSAKKKKDAKINSKRGSVKRKLLTNVSSSSSAKKYVNESDLFTNEAEDDDENINEVNQSSSFGTSTPRAPSLWSSHPYHLLDGKGHNNEEEDNDMIGSLAEDAADDDYEDANEEEEDANDKYYRDLIDPTLRDYQRESSLFFDEILNTNSPFL